MSQGEEVVLCELVSGSKMSTMAHKGAGFDDGTNSFASLYAAKTQLMRVVVSDKTRISSK